jgi:hypothetical protein
MSSAYKPIRPLPSYCTAEYKNLCERNRLFPVPRNLRGRSATKHSALCTFKLLHENQKCEETMALLYFEHVFLVTTPRRQDDGFFTECKSAFRHEPRTRKRGAGSQEPRERRSTPKRILFSVVVPEKD